MSTTLGTLLLILQAETSAFARGMGDARKLAFDTSGNIVNSLKQVGDQLTKLKFGNEAQWKRSGEVIGGVVAGIGVALVSATIVVAKQVASQAKEMEKLSQSYGLPISVISQLKVAAQITGVPMDALTAGIGRLAKNAALAAEGGKLQAAAFKSLGVEVTDGAGHLRPMDQLLADVSVKFRQLQDSTGKTALAMQLMGRGGAAMIPVLNHLKEAMDLSDQLGLTWSQRDAQAALTFQGSVELLDLKVTSLKQHIAFGILPALDALSTAFIKVGQNGSSAAQTLASDMGATLIRLVGTIDWVSTKMAQAMTLALSGPGTHTSWAEAKEQSKALGEAHEALMRTLGLSSVSGQKTAATAAALNPQVEKYAKELEKIEALHKSGQLTGQAYYEKNAAAVKKYNDAYAYAMQHPFWSGGAGDPKFSAAGKGKSGDDTDKQFASLMSSVNSALSKGEDPLLKEIAGIEELKQKIVDFQNAHPETIFLQLNDALRALATTEDDVRRKKLAEDVLRGTAGILSLPVAGPSASGSVQAQAELLRLQTDTDAQNRERLQIYEQTRSPMERYEEEVARLNTLYADHSSEEYVRALADARDRIREIYDPTVKYEKEIARLTEARRAQLITDADYLMQLKKLRAEEAMEKLQTAPKRGLAGVGQGIGAGAQAAAAQWQGMPAETGQAMIQVAQRMQNAFSTAFTQMILGTKTVGRAIREMGVAILSSIAETCAQMLAKWIVTHLIMATIAKLTGTDNGDTRAAKTIATNATVANSYAGVAAAEEFAIALGDTGNLFYALAMAGVAEAIGLTFAAQASAAGGMEVDRDQSVFVHKDEKILPARISRGFDRIISSFSLPAAGGGHLAFAGAGGGSNYSSNSGDNHFNFHNYGASDPDATANATLTRVKRFFRTGGTRK